MKASQWEMAAERLRAALRHSAEATRARRPRHIAVGGKLTMDLTWVTERLAVGGGIWNADNMAAVVRAGVTHIIDMQIEFDDTELARPYPVEVLWNPVEDDFQRKPPELFQRGVDFALEALERQDSKVLIHCAAGVHRAPMMALALLCSLNWQLGKAMELIERKRPVADFPEMYVSSVEWFLEQRVVGKPVER